MADEKHEDPKVKKLSIKEESVRELTDAEADKVAGGMRRSGGGGGAACGDTGTTLSTCTKIDTNTGVPTTETC